MGPVCPRYVQSCAGWFRSGMPIGALSKSVWVRSLVRLNSQDRVTGTHFPKMPRKCHGEWHPNTCTAGTLSKSVKFCVSGRHFFRI